MFGTTALCAREGLPVPLRQPRDH